MTNFRQSIGASPVATTSNTSWTDPVYKHDSSSESFIHYRITAFDDGDNESDYSNTVTAKGTPPFKASAPELPQEIALHQNYPNPFNPETSIRFDLPEAAHVKLTIYNMLGEKVRTVLDGYKETGYHNIPWDGKNGGR